MRVAINRPQMLVEQYDVPLLDTAPDAAILAMIVGVEPVSTMTVDTGPAYVAARGENDVAAAGRRIAEARAILEAAMADARDVAVAAVEAGQSQRAVTAALGLDRNTVRGLLGKGRAQ